MKLEFNKSPSQFFPFDRVGRPDILYAFFRGQHIFDQNRIVFWVVL